MERGNDMRNVSRILAGVAAGLLMLTAAPSAAAEPMTPLAVWEMNEPPGARAMVDSSGNGLHGYIGTSIKTGVVVEGETAYRWPYRWPASPPAEPERLLQISDTRLNPGTRDYAVTVQFKTVHGFGNIIQKGQSGAAGGMFKFQAPKGIVACIFRGSAGNSSVKSPQPLNDGAWHTVRCVRDERGVTMTVDGVDIRTNGQPTGNIANNATLTIGGKLYCDQVEVTCDYFSGNIGRVQIDVGTDVANERAGGLSFVAAASSTGNAISARLTLPAGIQPGDQLLLFLTTNRAATTPGPTAGGGWTQLQSGAGDLSQIQTWVWARSAVAGDAGRLVSVPLDVQAKYVLSGAAYRGAVIDSSALIAETRNRRDHTTPPATADDTGSWVVSFWSDKTSATTDWVSPAGVTDRAERIGIGSGRVSSLLADTKQVPIGLVAGSTATADASSLKATMVNVVLRPA